MTRSTVSTLAVFAILMATPAVARGQEQPPAAPTKQRATTHELVLRDGSRLFGTIEREGKKLYRYRAKDYRLYFEHTAEGITVHRVLHKNTIRDFLFRTKLPMAEDDQLGQTKAFWKLIHEGEKTRQR